MSVGLPTSTPAFQMAAMYGVRPDIPGFHYYDRERQSDIHFPRRGHAALVEERLSAGRRGILEGGSAYGCVFTGGADNDYLRSRLSSVQADAGCSPALSPFVRAWLGVLPSAGAHGHRADESPGRIAWRIGQSENEPAMVQDQGWRLRVDTRFVYHGGCSRSLCRRAGYVCELSSITTRRRTRSGPAAATAFS